MALSLGVELAGKEIPKLSASFANEFLQSFKTYSKSFLQNSGKLLLNFSNNFFILLDVERPAFATAGFDCVQSLSFIIVNFECSCAKSELGLYLTDLFVSWTINNVHFRVKEAERSLKRQKFLFCLKFDTL